jgi:hypothetical protein
MGVDLTVGYLDELRCNDAEGLASQRKHFAEVRKMLKKEKLPTYEEPEDLHGKGWRIRVWPQNGIAYFQRLAVYLWRLNRLPDPGTYDMGNPLQEKEIEFAYEDCYFGPEDKNKKGQNFAHLVCHSCRDGYWLPVAFDKVLTGKLGEFASAPHLRTACAAVAEELDLPLDLDPNDKDVQAALRTPGKGRKKWKRYGIESFNCLLLHRAATVSVAVGAAIVLH